jgi:hypothetical protein
VRLAALLVVVGCAHGSASDGRVELARARVSVAKDDGRAVELYEAVPRFSSAWPRALFEGGRERAKHLGYSRALGMLMTLHAPQLSAWMFPEAYALEADIYLRNCYFGKALSFVRQFRADVLPLRARVSDLVIEHAPIGDEVPQIATRLVDARTDDERWDHLDQLLVEIDLAAAVIDRVERDATEQMSKLVDVARLSPREQIFVIDEEHQHWTFDGEWWPDELGHYSVRLDSRCVRAR